MCRSAREGSRREDFTNDDIGTIRPGVFWRGREKKEALGLFAKYQAGRKNRCTVYSIRFPFHAGANPLEKPFHFRNLSERNHLNSVVVDDHLNRLPRR